MHFKILADEDVDYRIVQEIRKKDIEVISIVEQYRWITDKEILQLARKYNAIILTEDSDFGELIFAHKEKNISVIFLRYKSIDIQRISNSLLKVLAHYGNTLYGKFVVISVNKIRIREIY